MLDGDLRRERALGLELREMRCGDDLPEMRLGDKRGGEDCVGLRNDAVGRCFCSHGV